MAFDKKAYNREYNKKYNSKWYTKNKKKHIENVKKYNDERLKEFYEYKATLECEHCGENHPGCLDFHHKDPNKKDFEITTAIQRRKKSLNTIFEEIKKCIVLCANCHRKLHYKMDV